MEQAVLLFEYPKNPAHYGSQEWRVYEHLVARGEVYGNEFLNMIPPIPEYRSRINRLRHLLKPLGWWIDSIPVKGIRFNMFKIVKYEERRLAA